MRRRLYLFALTFALGAAPSALAEEPTFTTIDFPGAESTQAWGINDRGDIVGNYVFAGETHGFLRSRSSFTPIDYPGAISTFTSAINARGDIVGSYVSGGVTHGFLLSEGQYSTIDYPGAASSELLGINSRGDIVGDYSSTRLTPCCALGTHGFLLSEHGGFTPIDFPGATVLTYASGINPQGDIAGAYSDGVGRAFLLSHGVFTALNPPTATTSFMNALGINAEGDIVGRYVDASGPRFHGYLLSEGQYNTFDAPGANFTGFTAINSEGDIAGRYRTAADGRFHGFLLSRREDDK